MGVIVNIMTNLSKVGLFLTNLQFVSKVGLCHVLFGFVLFSGKA